MQYFFDIRENTLQLVRGGPAIKRSDVVSGAKVNIRVQFVDGTQAKKFASPQIWYGITDPSDSNTIVALADTWTYDPASESYLSVLDLNTEEVVSALGSQSEIAVNAQLIWKDGSNGPFHSQVIDVELDKSVLDFDAATPLPLPTPAEWLANALATAPDKVLPEDNDSIPLSDSADGGSLKKLTIENLWEWIVSKMESAKVTVRNAIESVAWAIDTDGPPEDEGTGYVVGGTIPLEGRGLIIPASLVGDNAGNPCWNDDGSEVSTIDGGATPVFGTWKRVCYFTTIDGAWIFAYVVGDRMYRYYKTPGDILQTPDELTGWENTQGNPPPYYDSTGNPSFTAYSSAGTAGFVPGQVGFTSEDDPYVRKPGDTIQFSRLLTPESLQKPTNSFQIVPNDDGGFDLALWNSDQVRFQKIVLSGESGLETISFES